MFDLKLEKKDLPFAMAEEIINLRTGISFSGENIKTVVFTSCTANEGKSTISLEVVRSFADMGKKALFIDCDLRKSILNKKIIEGKINKGLTHYLTGQCDLEDVIYTNLASNDDVEFDFIPCGPLSNSPTELLASEKFDSMLNQMREEYDIIIMDTPPLGTVIDASIISAKADGAVLVIESGNINYKAIQKVRDKLLLSGARVLGVVLNKVDKTKNSYGYYQYGYGYGYGYGNNKDK